MDAKKELEKIRKSFENDSAYAHALKELIEKNDTYGKLYAMSLLCLILNISHKKWTTKDNIKQDFKEEVKKVLKEKND